MTRRWRRHRHRHRSHARRNPPPGGDKRGYALEIGAQKLANIRRRALFQRTTAAANDTKSGLKSEACEFSRGMVGSAGTCCQPAAAERRSQRHKPTTPYNTGGVHLRWEGPPDLVKTGGVSIIEENLFVFCHPGA